MSLLDTITMGIKKEGLRGVIAGVEKIGKTTLACDAPNCLLIPLEIGYASITIPKTKFIKTFADFEQLLSEIIDGCQEGKFPYKSLVIDSVTALERMVHDHVVKMDPNYGNSGSGNSGRSALTIETAMGGYGKGHAYANEIFEIVLKKLDYLASNFEINILFTAHVFASKMIDPLNGEYDSWDILLHSPKNQKTYGKREMLTQWADLIGYLHEPIYINPGEKLNQAVSANKGRVLGLSRTPAYVAGNRFGYAGEVQISKQDGWNDIAKAISSTSEIKVFNDKHKSIEEK